MNTTQQTEKQNNRDIIQSYIFTIAKYEANIYVKRILTHIIDANQNYLEGVNFKGGTIVSIEEDLFKDREYTLNAKELLQDSKDKNYQRIYEAFDYLQTKFFAYEDDEIRFRAPFITAVYAKKGDGTIRFRMSELVYKAFTDYTKGYRKYELRVSLSLSSVYSIRLYELLSGQKDPITYKIDKLREMFGVVGKYKQVNDFLKRIVVPAQKELDEKSPYTFTYRVNKKGRKFDSITFYPKYQPQHRDDRLEQKELDKKVSLSWDFTTMEKAYLIDNFDFSTKEIKNNLETFKEFKAKGYDLLDFLTSSKRRILDAKNPKGYIIGMLKTAIKTEQKTMF